MDFYVLLASNKLKYLSVSQEIQMELTEQFSTQANKFLEDAELIPFDVGYKPDFGELLQISNYRFPDGYIETLQNPLECDKLIPNDTRAGNIKAIIGCQLSDVNETELIVFKSIDRSKVIDKTRLSLFFSNDTLDRSTQPGLIIPERVDAVFDGTGLKFFSYFTAKKFLDLSPCFEESSNNDIDSFVNSSPVVIANYDSFLANLDSWSRRKISMLKHSRVWKTASVQDIHDVAPEFGVHVELIEENGEPKIALPDDKQEMKKVLRFLNDDFLTSQLTDIKYMTNSKTSI